MFHADENVQKNAVESAKALSHAPKSVSDSAELNGGNPYTPPPVDMTWSSDEISLNVWPIQPLRLATQHSMVDIDD